MKTTAKILVVEDDSFLAEDLRQHVISIGYSALETIDTGEEVLKRIHELKPSLILMDIGLKGKLDGIQTAAQLQKLTPQIPVIFMTASNDEATLQRAKLTMPFGYIIKPFEPLELKAAIDLTLLRSKGEQPLPDARDSELEEPVLELGGQDFESRFNFLSNLPLFQSLPAPIIKSFAEQSSIREFDAGEFLIFEGDKAEFAFVPAAGRICVMKTSAEGKELIVSLIGPGDGAGFLFVLQSFSGGLAVRAQVPSRVLLLPAKVFKDAMLKSVELANKVVEKLADSLVLSHKLSSSLAHSRVEDRIINTLIALLPECGKSTVERMPGPGAKQSTGSSKGGPTGYRIYITRRELADLTGTTPETAIRVTKNLERAGVLDLSRPGIIKILDISKLSN